MSEPISLQVITPRRVVERSRVRSLVVPGQNGQMGIWSRHAPAMVALNPGLLRYRREDGVHLIAVHGGFAEVYRDRVVVLADAAELPHEIDIERAQAARRRAEERLQGASSEDIDQTRARAALERALARLRLAERTGDN